MPDSIRAPDTPPTIGGRLRQLRSSREMTQQQFADALGMKQTTYSKYETEVAQPTGATIQLIVQTFGVSEAWLRSGVGPMLRERSRDEEISFQVARLVRSDNAELKALVRLMLELPPEAARLIVDFARRLVEESEAQNPKDP